MNKKQAQEYEEKRQQMKTALKKRRYPTIVSVLSMGDETSKMMKEENRRKRKESLYKRAMQGAKR